MYRLFSVKKGGKALDLKGKSTEDSGKAAYFGFRNDANKFALSHGGDTLTELHVYEKSSQPVERPIPVVEPPKEA